MSYRKLNPKKIDPAEMERDFWSFMKERADLKRKRSDSILHKYLSHKLYNYLKHVNDKGLVLDYDPLVHGQMIDKEMLERLTIRKDSAKNDVYYAVFTYSTESQVKVTLTIVSENDGYKIDHVFIKDESAVK